MFNDLTAVQKSSLICKAAVILNLQTKEKCKHAEFTINYRAGEVLISSKDGYEGNVFKGKTGTLFQQVKTRKYFKLNGEELVLNKEKGKVARYY